MFRRAAESALTRTRHQSEKVTYPKDAVRPHSAFVKAVHTTYDVDYPSLAHRKGLVCATCRGARVDGDIVILLTASMSESEARNLIENGGVTKKILVEGTGDETPPHGSDVFGKMT